MPALPAPDRVTSSTKKTAEAHGIKNIGQISDPEVAAIFDSDGDGRANLSGCNPGWGCELAIEDHLDAYKLRDTVQHDQGSYFAIMADTITRYNEGGPDPLLHLDAQLDQRRLGARHRRGPDRRANRWRL